MSRNMENVRVVTGLEKVNLHPNPKKRSTKECSNYRTVAVIPHPESSKDCQEAHWLTHKISCDGSSAQHETKDHRDLQNNTLECSEANPMEELQESYIVIKIKHQKIKTNLKIPTSASGEEALELVSKYLRIPPENLKLVSKGKLMSKENILSFLATGSIFQAFGEQAENEDGLDFRDIEVLMAQLSVERNVAVKALRKTGDLIDAILYVSDNM